MRGGQPGATVVLRGGDDLIEKTLALESGLTLHVQPGETARLVAARPVKAAVFAKSDLPGGQVFMLDLKVPGIRHLGQ